MRLIIQLNLSEQIVPINYRFACISYIKKLLSNNQLDYDEQYLNIDIKKFTFAMYFSNAKIFDKNKIICQDKYAKLTISSYDASLLMKLYNASLKVKGLDYPFGKNLKVKTSSVKFINTDIAKNQIIVKTLSPICVRYHNANEKDRYLTFSDQDFLKVLNINVENLANSLGLNFEPIEIMPITAKTTVVKMRDDSYRVSFGKFLIKSSVEMVDMVLKAGLGSRRAQGFGLLEVIT